MNSKEYDKRLDQLVEEVDKLPAHKRLSYLEQGMAKIHQELKSDINNSLIDKLSHKTENTNPIQCTCGDKLYYQEKVKKDLAQLVKIEPINISFKVSFPALRQGYLLIPDKKIQNKIAGAME